MFTFFIKELRQLRRDMVFWGALSIQIVLSMLVVIAATRSGLSGLNYYTSIGFLASFVAAIAMSIRWNNDLCDDALNPLITTPLSPTAVVAGKYLATFVAVLIPLAVTQIFIVSTAAGGLEYYFCGLLPLDAATLLTSAALFTASASQSKRRGTVGTVLPAIFLLLILTNIRNLVFMPLAVTDSSHAVFIAVLILLIIPLLFALTTAAVSAPGSDRAIPVRIAMLLTMAAYVIVIRVEGSLLSSSLALSDLCTVVCMIGAVISAVAAVTERRTQSPRVVAAIRNTPAPWRPLRILCSSGAITEMILSLVLAAAAAIHGICRGSYAALQFYAMFLFGSSLTLFVAVMLQLNWGKKLSPMVSHFIFLPVFFLQCWVVIKFIDTESMQTVFAVTMTVISLAMLIPVAYLFLDSLKRK